jgi:hypothetical protein
MLNAIAAEKDERQLNVVGSGGRSHCQSNTEDEEQGAAASRVHTVSSHGAATFFHWACEVRLGNWQ